MHADYLFHLRLKNLTSIQNILLILYIQDDDRVDRRRTSSGGSSPSKSQPLKSFGEGTTSAAELIIPEKVDDGDGTVDVIEEIDEKCQQDVDEDKPGKYYYHKSHC